MLRFLSRERSTVIALMRFCSWLRSFWQVTTMPVGMWVMRTAESVLLTCWPPAPEARMVSMRMSSGRMSMSTSSASGSTATVAADVWMRPLASVAGMRCTRCTPLSNLSLANTPWPVMEATISR